MSVPAVTVSRRFVPPSCDVRLARLAQRGCGRSTPHAGAPVIDLSTNTTAHLIADIEFLRRHLDVEEWSMLGGSWGATLGFAYAERHPERVSELVLFAATSTRRREVERITRDVGRLFPAEWARFRDGVPAADRDGGLADAYGRLLHDPDPAVREKAARDWCAWEDAHVAVRPGHRPDPRYEDPAFRPGSASTRCQLLRVVGTGARERLHPPAKGCTVRRSYRRNDPFI